VSLIIQDSGLFSIVQSLDERPSSSGSEYNGACDRLAHQLANQLVGNPADDLTIEMTVRPATIKFTEPTIIAFSGAEFVGRCNDQQVHPNRIYLFDRGDVLEFVDTPRGNRIYLAVAGGIKAEGSNVLQSGDEVVMCRDYTVRHDELFNMLRNKNMVSWGVDTYSLVEIYISDLFHIVRRPDVNEEVYDMLENAEFTVLKEKNRVSLHLAGRKITPSPSNIVHPGIKGGVYLADGAPILALNDFNQSTTAEHIGTIPSYHMHKLSQKRTGSRLKFKVIDCDASHANLYAQDLWVKSLFKAIDYKLSKELVKEKM